MLVRGHYQRIIDDQRKIVAMLERATRSA